jgi:hypothetical protein
VSVYILELRPRALNLPVQRTEDEGLSPWKAGSKQEEKSRIIEAAVAYCCSKCTAEPVRNRRLQMQRRYIRADVFTDRAG